MTSQLYADAALTYRGAGWRSAFPLPPNAKKFPPTGITGWAGRWPTQDDYDAWQEARPDGNIGLRLHEDQLGIDVDAYGDKDGGQTLTELEHDLGTLPDTWLSTSRSDGVSGIRLFTVPAGLTWENQPGIDMIHTGHRYVVAPPSIHTSGQPYRWIHTGTGEVLEPGEVPDPATLPTLPAEWIARLGRNGGANIKHVLNDAQAQAIYDGLPDGDICQHITRAVDAVEGSRNRHDDYRDAVMRVARRGRLGCPGARHAVETLRASFIFLVGPDRGEAVAAHEFDSFTRGALEIIAGSEQAATGCAGEAELQDGSHRSHPLGQRLAADHVGHLCFVPGIGWHEWTGAKWQAIEEDAAAHLAGLWVVRWINSLIAEQAPGAVITSALRYREIGALLNLLRAARTSPVIRVDAGRLDSNPGLVNVRNGIVDLRTGELRPHDPELYFTKITDIDYLEGATHSDWSKALAALPDATTEEWVAKHFGAALTGTPGRSDVLTFHVGSGSNGKSSVFGAVTTAFGDFSATMPEKLISGGESHETVFMPLRGARLVTLEELPEGHVLPVARIKTIIDTPRITARAIRKDFVTWDATHSLAISTNYDPRVKETDYGTWRRLKKVPYPHTYRGESRDVTLRTRLLNRDQQRAVLSWLVEGAQRWYAEGCSLEPYPQAIEDATAEWRQDADPLLGFLDDAVEVTHERTDWISTRELLARYNSTHNSGTAWSETLFTGRLTTHPWVEENGLTLARRITGGSKLRALEGVRWRHKGLRNETPNYPVNPVRREENPPTGQGGQGRSINSRENHSSVVNRPTLSALSSTVAAIDLETAGAAALWGPIDPGFIRLMAWNDGETSRTTSDHDLMREWIRDADQLLMHNGLNYDVPALARHLGMDYDEIADKTIDTMLMARLVWPPTVVKPGEAGEIVKYGLDDLARRIGIDGKPLDLRELARHHNKTAKLNDPFTAIPTDDPDLIAYAKRDVEITWKLWGHLQARFPDAKYARREWRALRAATAIGWRGLTVNADLLAERLRTDQDRRDGLKAELAAYGIEVGEKLGDTGKLALARVLREQAGATLPPGDKKPGIPQIGSDILKTIDHPAARAVLALNRDRGLPKQVAARVCPNDGKVHPNVDPSHQASGRWSITGPGLTTWGKRSAGLLLDRHLFTADPGEVLFAVDLAQIDVRGMAAASGDEAMIARLQPGMDWHMEVAELVFGERTKEARNKAKTLAHAINYSAGPATVAEHAGVTIDRAQEIIDELNEGLPGLAAFKARAVAAARAGQPITNGWGRHMSPTKGREVTQVPGLIGQGWARDAVMQCLLQLVEAGLGGAIVLHVHDEFVFSVPEDQAEALRARAVEAMTFEKDGVPITCEATGFGHTWGEVYS